MNHSGHWKGIYIYGRGYPPHMRGRADEFELFIEEEDGKFTGTFVDDIVRETEGNEGTVEGFFRNDRVVFIKKYKYPKFVAASKEWESRYERQSSSIHYKGKLKRRFFSRKFYFDGEWTIQERIRDRLTGEIIPITSGSGTWVMEKQYLSADQKSTST